MGLNHYSELTPSRRFEAARIVLNLSKETLYKELDTTRTIYKHMLMGKKKLPLEWAGHMEEKYRVSINWLLVGKGDILIPKVNQ